MRKKLYLILYKVMLADEEKSRYKPTGQSILKFYRFPQRSFQYWWCR